MLGVPLISRAIGICQESGIFESIVVSTDSPEVRQLTLALGVSVVDRPENLADDHTPLLPVLSHAVSGLDAESPVCCFYATAVTLLPEDLRASWAVFTQLQGHDSLNTSFLTGVVEYRHPIQRALELDESGKLQMLYPEFAQTRTQDLPPRWHDAGVFIWGTKNAWSQPEPVLTRAHGFPLPSSRVVDIDTEEDWIIAERVLAAQSHG